ncbi:MAG: DAK2 domain-containing protein [Erysipelotrichaceae bacterium]|nr:DAK2 domain-containing protein [Erysipelotrichaceae bacterium]
MIMDDYLVNGLDFITMLDNGAKNLASDFERINALNVFPVPDGDTGTNMSLTISGGVKEGKNLNEINIGKISKAVSRAMVLSARGNSGVILSQFFKGLSIGLDGYESVSVKQFAEAMIQGTKRAYSVVSNPTEGTILTIMREAGEEAYSKLDSSTTMEEYLVHYLKSANSSLERTPELLPVLKKAGVIDSGGAGFILIIEGMLRAITGDVIEGPTAYDNAPKAVNTSGFNADSELTYGYCTEFILQLQNSKVNVESFDLNIITDFLKSIGNSIVSFKDEDLIKVHVHTFDPGIVLTECRKYGEFVTLKIENMNVQHSESSDYQEATEATAKEHKKYALVAVANGSGLVKTFKEMGVDEVVTGGQTMNTSTQDFISAFEKIDADNILVFPNNSNILMAANVAADTYDKANIYVVPTKTISEGYSAISMLNFDSDDINTILAEEAEAISNVSTLEVTYSIRDTVINDIDIKKGDFICLYNNELISCDKNRLEAVKKAFNAISDFKDKQVLTVLCGQDVAIEEFNELHQYAETLNSYIEVYPIQGDQDIYSYIIGIE